MLTHVWICGRWVWRTLTFAQWSALSHVGKKFALIKAAKVAGTLACAGGIGVGLPPLIDGLGRPRLDQGVAEPRKRTTVPEPWSMALLAVGALGIVLARMGGGK